MGKSPCRCRHTLNVSSDTHADTQMETGAGSFSHRVLGFRSRTRFLVTPRQPEGPTDKGYKQGSYNFYMHFFFFGKYYRAMGIWNADHNFLISKWNFYIIWMKTKSKEHVTQWQWGNLNLWNQAWCFKMLRGFPRDYPNLAIEEKYKLPEHRDAPWGLPGTCTSTFPNGRPAHSREGTQRHSSKGSPARALKRHLLSSTQAYPAGPQRPQRSGPRIMMPGEGREERRAAHPAD